MTCQEIIQLEGKKTVSQNAFFSRKLCVKETSRNFRSFYLWYNMPPKPNSLDQKGFKSKRNVYKMVNLNKGILVENY